MNSSSSKSSSPNAVLSNLSSVDEYGFERKGNFDFSTYEEFMSEYISILTQRGRKWEALLRNKNSIGRSRKLKRYIRKGIPLRHRGRIWMTISGAEARKAAQPAYYAKLLIDSKSQEMVEAIKLDVHRTFPENMYFKGRDSDKLKSLSNVLEAFGHHNPSIGYCQGLNYIVGMLLLVIGIEESVFWLLTVLIEEILPGYHTEDMTGALADIYTLGLLVREKRPLLWKHLEFNKVELSLVVTKWFICLFVEVLPTETVLRVWDCLFYEGNKILMRVSVALILSNEEEIFKSHDFCSIINCFKNMTRNKQALHCHTFLKAVFETTGPMPRIYINELRKLGQQQALSEKKKTEVDRNAYHASG